MRIILIPSLWLDGTAWRDVLPGLEAAGHQPVGLMLPGQGDGNAAATLDDQLAAVLAAIDSSPAPVTVVGHSAAGTLAWLAADRRPDRMARVAIVAGVPCSEGEAYADFFEPVDGLMVFPGWGAFDGPDSADLDDAARARLEATMHPVPVAVSRGIVHYTDEARRQVPVSLVCAEYSVADARAWVEQGVPELLAAEQLDYVDIDSGHWPMTSVPSALADLLAQIAAR